LLPVKLNPTPDFRSQQLDISWNCAVVTFDGTTPIYTEINGKATGLWMTVEYPPAATVTPEN
jgi:hypothetical protein